MCPRPKTQRCLKFVILLVLVYSCHTWHGICAYSRVSNFNMLHTVAIVSCTCLSSGPPFCILVEILGRINKLGLLSNISRDFYPLFSVVRVVSILFWLGMCGSMYVCSCYCSFLLVDYVLPGWIGASASQLVLIIYLCGGSIPSRSRDSVF